MLHHSTVRDGVQISALVCKIFLSCHEMCMQKVGRSAVWTNDKSSYKTSSLFTRSRYWNGFNNWKVNIFLFLSIILRLFFSSLQHYQSNFVSEYYSWLPYFGLPQHNWGQVSQALVMVSQLFSLLAVPDQYIPLKNALTWLWQFIKSKSYQPHICQYYRFFSS